MLTFEFKEFIKKHNLFTKGDTVIAAVSGGADSMCLLHLLSQMDIRVICAHVNHGIRADAQKDSDFVEAFCKERDIEFESLSADVKGYAQSKSISEEMAGREIRYKFFFKLLKEYNAKAIATAHNKNDQSETVLLNLIRGSGMAGLSGFAPKRGDGVVHPLSDITRDRIEEYLKFHGISWCEDSTNAQTDYTRNKIRHLVIPEILKINPGFTDNVARCADILRSENEFLNSLAAEQNAFCIKDNKAVIKAELLVSMPEVLAKRVIIAAANSVGVIPDARIVNEIYALAEKNSGRQIPVRGKVTAIKQYDSIIMGVNEKVKDFMYKLPEEGELLIDETKTIITVSKEAKQGYIGLKAGEYSVRNRRNGDRFKPEKMSGSKKLKEFFIDIKLPAQERDKVPIIVSGDEIAMVGNIRRGRDFTGDDIFIKIHSL